jgi:hypothetical protein
MGAMFLIVVPAALLSMPSTDLPSPGKYGRRMSELVPFEVLRTDYATLTSDFEFSNSCRMQRGGALFASFPQRGDSTIAAKQETMTRDR